MPKSYTEKEREIIMENLRAAALESMQKQGVKKTTVDELVKKVQQSYVTELYSLSMEKWQR